MNPIYYLLICCFLGLFGCTNSDVLSNFTKRKYLKKTPKQITVEQTCCEQVAYAGKELEYIDYVLEEIPEVDDAIVIESLSKDNVDQEHFVDYSLSAKYVEKSNHIIANSDINPDKKYPKHSAGYTLLVIAIILLAVIGLVFITLFCVAFL